MTPVTIDEQDLFNGLKECLEASLGRSIPDFEANQKLVGDLGLDSLDLLDLIFRLERRFRVRLNPKDYELKVRAALGQAPVSENGQYTAAAVAEFRKAMPCVPADELYEGLPVANLGEVFRVRTFMNLVTDGLKGQVK
ncbi:MAG: phosphopantetheine-binding protein [Deltaproteobacteria bacterium]|nr:phosphopantetheine-binding protein [Deltaproteobacteria bacterium]